MILAREIVDDFKGEKLDYWGHRFGTGGTLKGVARVLAKERPDTKIVVCEPADAPMLSSKSPQERNPDEPVSRTRCSSRTPCKAGAPTSFQRSQGYAIDMGVISRIVTLAGPTRLNAAASLRKRKAFFVWDHRRRHLRRRA